METIKWVCSEWRSEDGRFLVVDCGTWAYALDTRGQKYTAVPGAAQVFGSLDEAKAACERAKAVTP